MKSIKVFISVLLLATGLLLSCKQNTTDDLAKTWLVTDIHPTVNLPDTLKSRLISGSEMTFTKDGKYTTTGGIGVDQGTYTVDKDGKTLSTVSQAGKSSAVYEINSLSKTELKLTNNGNTVTLTANK